MIRNSISDSSVEIDGNTEQLVPYKKRQPDRKSFTSRLWHERAYERWRGSVFRWECGR